MKRQNCHVKVGGTTQPPMLEGCACNYINKGPQFCDPQGHGPGVDVEFLLVLLVNIMNCTVECVDVSDKFDVKSALLTNRINISLTLTDQDNEGLTFNDTYTSGTITEDGIAILTRATFDRKPGDPTTMFDLLIIVSGFLSLLMVGSIEYLEVVWFPLPLSKNCRRVADAGKILADFLLVCIVLGLYSNMLTVEYTGKLEIRTRPFAYMMDLAQSLYRGECRLVVNRVLYQKDLKVFVDFGATPRGKGKWPQVFRDALDQNAPVFTSKSSELGQILSRTSYEDCHVAIVYESQIDYFDKNFCGLKAIQLQSRPPNKRFHYAISRKTSYNFVKAMRSLTSDPQILEAYNQLVARYAKPLKVPECKKRTYQQRLIKLTNNDLYFLKTIYGRGMLLATFVIVAEGVLRLSFSVLRNIRHKLSPSMLYVID